MVHLYAQRKRGRGRALAVTAGVFAVLLLAFLLSMNVAGNRLDQQQATLLRDTLSRAAITCFAVEGRYPPTLDYLTTHYGVSYDAGKYVVIYDIFADNIAPVISVREVGAMLE